MLLLKLFMNIYICSNISNEVTRIQNSKIKIILLANLHDDITRKLLYLEKSYYTSMNRTNFYLSYDLIGIKSKFFFINPRAISNSVSKGKGHAFDSFLLIL